MSAQEFWEGEPRLAEAYRQAYQITQEREAFAEWRQGFYVLRAIANVFGKDTPYPEEPVFMSEAPESIRKKERIQGENNLIKMEAFASAFNSKFKE